MTRFRVAVIHAQRLFVMTMTCAPLTLVWVELARLPALIAMTATHVHWIVAMLSQVVFTLLSFAMTTIFAQQTIAIPSPVVLSHQ
jgi:hypothetical protein